MSKEVVLLTGVAGFIGSHTVKTLLEQEYQVIGVDNFLTGKEDNLEDLMSENFNLIRANVNNPAEVNKIFSDFSISYVFHYAAVVGVERTLKNPLLVLEDIKGIKNICENSVKHKIKRVFFSSSSEVYGESLQFPQKEEETPLNSRLPYAIVKNFSEVTLKSFNFEYGLNYTIFRFFNTYGPKQSEDFVMTKFISQALRGEDITIYGEGNQTRTFCYVEDNTKFTTSCLILPKTINQTYNVGTCKETSILELAELIKRITKSKSKIKHLSPLKEGDMGRRIPSIEKMMNSVGEKKFIPLEIGIEKTIDYFKKKNMQETI